MLLFCFVTGLCLGSRGATTAEKLRGSGGPRFGSEHRGACTLRPAKSRAGCWVRKGVAPPTVKVRGITPENFLKTQMLNPAFWWLLAVKFLAFWKYGQEVGEGTNALLVPNLKVGGRPVSPGPYGCCAYMVQHADLPLCIYIFSSIFYYTYKLWLLFSCALYINTFTVNCLLTHLFTTFLQNLVTSGVKLIHCIRRSLVNVQRTG